MQEGRDISYAIKICYGSNYPPTTSSGSSRNPKQLVLAIVNTLNNKFWLIQKPQITSSGSSTNPNDKFWLIQKPQ